MRTLVVLSLALVAVACKGKPKHQEPPPGLSPGSAAAAGSGRMKPAPDIQLPHGDGHPPVKTTAALDLPVFEKLQKLTYPGFTLQPHGINPKMGVEMRQKTEDHPRLWATVTIAPCSKDAILGECVPMELDKWKARSAELKASLMQAELRDLPDTVFEIGITQLNGVPVIYQYQLAESAPETQPAAGSAAGSGSAAKPKAGSAAPKAGSGSAGSAAPSHGPGFFAWSHAYTLYYNDGQNQIRVVAEFKDDPVDSKEAMAKLVPREDLENVARAFVDVYTQAW